MTQNILVHTLYNVIISKGSIRIISKLKRNCACLNEGGIRVTR